MRALYGRVEDLLRDARCRVRLLNAFDADGHLAACLVMDEAPAHFDTYLLGAHSREHPTPYATDALFALMLERARQRGKRSSILGLGVNAGISRFKRKWGGRPALRYIRADWEEPKRDEAFMLALLASMHTDPDAAWSEAQREMEHAQVQRPFRMLWKVEKNAARPGWAARPTFSPIPLKARSNACSARWIPSSSKGIWTRTAWRRSPVRASVRPRLGPVSMTC